MFVFERYEGSERAPAVSHMRDDVRGKSCCHLCRGANADKLHKVEAETEFDIEELKFEEMHYCASQTLVENEI